MSSSEQLHRPADLQNRGEYSSPADSHQQTGQSDPAAESRRLGGGTDVMGAPVNPTSQYSHPHGNPSNAAALSSDSTYPPPPYSSAAGDSYSYTTMMTPAGGSQPSTTANLPGATKPYSGSADVGPAGQTPTHSSFAADAHQSATATGGPSPSPYVQTSSIPGATGKTPMDSILQVFNKWSKKAEDMTGNVWNHLKTGPNVADTALGRIAIGTKAMAEGGLENVFRQTFDVAPEEHLLKSYACYLSTSSGPVAGTLYISSHKLAFCSDRPLAIPASSPTAANQTATPNTTPSATASNTKSAQQQQQWCFYKMVVPVVQLEAVNPSENTQKKPPEKYVQVKTVDGHEFWFMGFVNYDKGVRNLQEALVSKNAAPAATSPTSDTNAMHHVS